MFIQSIAMKILSLLLLLPFYACSQTTKPPIGGPCEGCEAIHESPVTFYKLKHTDTLAGFFEPGEKLHIKGVVYNADNQTPAPGVIIYLYHNDNKGLYPTKGNEKGWDKRHGYLRGWLKTNDKGEYECFTNRPASYPNSNNPQHIHITIKEPGKNEYWIDEIHFTDDPLLTAQTKSHFQNRGGSGLVTLVKKNNMLYGQRNIILGKNVPGYY
jgi:protocatechuate 3,4-dioxygenase beta subunit